jgi:hypothetical protein
MQKNEFLKAGLFTLILTIAGVGSYEFWLRNHGYSISYDDDERLWADKRSQVYESPDKAVVFIGSSRIKFDLDIPTWKKETGQNAIQLAMVGSTPLPLLHDLAEDKNFKGKLIVDVTEILFFNNAKTFLQRPSKGINYYHKNTPSGKAGFAISHLLESKFVFLDNEFFSLDAHLKKLHVKDRPGIYGGLEFPWEFDRTMFDRQSKMDDRFVKDTNLQNQVRAVWSSLGKAMKDPPPSGAALDTILASVKADVDKIKARGGQVLFVRTPSSGPFWMGEQQGFPREKYWDKILEVTGCAGVYFKDYDAIANFQCPEFSHLSPSDAAVFTKNLVQILEKDKGWQFPNKSSL